MTWLLKYDKLLVVLILAIGIIFMVAIWVYEEAHLTANLMEVDEVIDTEYMTIYVILKERGN